MKTKVTFLQTLFLMAALCAVLAVPRTAQAQTYRVLTLPNLYTSVSAGINTNGVGFDNSNGGTANTGLKLPRNLSSGFTFQTTFSCPTVTLAAVSFVLQGSVDGTSYNNIPGTTVNAVVPASAASANNTNVVYLTNFPASAVQNFNWIRLAGITNGNAATASSITTQIGYWE